MKLPCTAFLDTASHSDIHVILILEASFCTYPNRSITGSCSICGCRCRHVRAQMETEFGMTGRTIEEDPSHGTVLCSGNVDTNDKMLVLVCELTQIGLQPDRKPAIE